jgi:DNA polymerase III alpha subunit
MNRYYYDLHVHSCLSPCGDDDNTPNNIAGMASLCELDIVALTDHNSCKNCPAFFEAAEKNNIIPIAGMELTTSEDIHVVCLFENLDDALSFDAYVNTQRIFIKNKPSVFGRQMILDGEDEIIGEEEFLLTNATKISIEDVNDIVKKFHGISFPAHIDKNANGIIAILGTLPKAHKYTAVEIHSSDNLNEYSKKYELNDTIVIFSSDAHYLTDIKDKENYVELSADRSSPDMIRRELISLLGGRR